MENNYYIYLYLDPRKNGNFVYSEYIFEYEPIYVGKGVGNRYKEHLRNSRLNLPTGNKIKQGKLKKILSEGLKPIIVKLHENLSEENSLKLEKDIIFKIGRIINKTGPLTNLTEGGDGVSGRLITEEFKLEQSKRMIKYYENNPISNEVSKKISSALLNKKIVRSEATKLKISNANKNRIYSDEYLKRLKEIRKGPKITHRKKYILINPNQIIFDFLGKEELTKFIHENELSERKILNYINKGVITVNDVRLTKNTENIKTKNCIGWEIKTNRN